MTAARRPALRALLAPAVTTATAFAILIGLGIWQLDRLAWKQGLIAALHARLSAEPVPLPAPQDWDGLTPQADEFRRVRLRADFSDAPRAHLYAGAPALRPDITSPGYFVFAPARLPGGETVVVNAGWVPLERRYDWQGGSREITGYLRFPEQPGWFVSDHDRTGDIWFVRDHRAMAALRGWKGRPAPFYIDMEGPPPADALPRPGPLAVNLRNNHLGYALTWFGLAATLLGVFAFWLRSRYSKTVHTGATPSL